MTQHSELTKDYKSIAGNIISSLFGILAMAIGLVNCFWGNDPGYGVFIVLFSLVFFPPVTDLIKKITGISVHYIIKILIAIFIIWSALGVGELGDKIDLMLKNF